MNKIKIERLQENENMLRPLGSEVWLMDDHRWAFYVWEKFASEKQIHSFSLIHADYHWDGVNDFRDDDAALQRLREAHLSQIFNMVHKNDYIRLDSFIAPAVIRGLLSEVHFFCKQDDAEIGLDNELLKVANVKQYIYPTPEAFLNASFVQPVIFDLCLDLFNAGNATKFGEGSLWPDDRIMTWLLQMRPLIERAVLVTGSLSFGFSGTEDDTRHLAKLIIPSLLKWRNGMST